LEKKSTPLLSDPNSGKKTRKKRSHAPRQIGKKAENRHDQAKRERENEANRFQAWGESPCETIGNDLATKAGGERKDHPGEGGRIGSNVSGGKKEGEQEPHYQHVRGEPLRLLLEWVEEKKKVYLKCSACAGVSLMRSSTRSRGNLKVKGKESVRLPSMAAMGSRKIVEERKKEGKHSAA